MSPEAVPATSSHQSPSGRAVNDVFVASVFAGGVRPGGAAVIRPPDGMSAYMFAVVASLRAAQLMRGCLPRVEAGSRKATVIARLEVAGGYSGPLPAADAGVPASRNDS